MGQIGPLLRVSTDDARPAARATLRQHADVILWSPAPRVRFPCGRRLLGSVDGIAWPPSVRSFGSLERPRMTSTRRQPHILVINDTQEILDLIQVLLEDEGYRVTTSLALLNLDKVKALMPDVIVQDLLFEGMQETGWKFLTLVRLDPQLAHIPLILCTAAVQTINDPQMAAQLDRLGVRVVLKPFDLEELLRVLAETLTAQGLIAKATDRQTP
jgi:CheY-like chemotaxis protein